MSISSYIAFFFFNFLTSFSFEPKHDKQAEHDISLAFPSWFSY